MATTTQTANSKTTTTYNKDYSAADTYKNQMTTPEYEAAKQDDINTYAQQQGVDYTYSENDLANKYQQLQDAALENTLYGVAQSQNSYNQSMNDTNRSVIDALRSETASAIANGTSRGVTDANVLKSILGLQQESVADATELAQQYGQAYKDYGENSAQAWIDANTAAAGYQNQLLDDTLTKQQTAQTSLDNKYTADAGIAAQQAETYGDLLAALASQVTSEETSSSATTTEPDVVTTNTVDTTDTTSNPDNTDNTYNWYNGTRDTSLVDTRVATDDALKDTVDGKAYGSASSAQKAADKLGAKGEYMVVEKRGKNTDGNNSKYYAIVKNPNYKGTETEKVASTDGTQQTYTKTYASKSEAERSAKLTGGTAVKKTTSDGKVYYVVQ